MPKGVRKQESQTDGAGISKTEGVRRALAELGLDAKPLKIKDFLQTKLGIVMNTSVISSYKSNLSKKAAGQSGIVQPTRSRTAPASPSNAAGGISVEDIRAIKELADRLGADKVQELAQILSQ